MRRMRGQDLIQKPTDLCSWRSASFFEYAGPPSCRVGVLCRALHRHYLSKAQVEAAGLCLAQPVSLSEPGGSGCLHRLVPISQPVAEALGLRPVVDALIVAAATGVDLEPPPGISPGSDPAGYGGFRFRRAIRVAFVDEGPFAEVDPVDP